MLDRQYTKVVFECDGCDATLETGTVDFGEANGIRKDEGWTSRQSKRGIWEHFCPKCSK